MCAESHCTLSLEVAECDLTAFAPLLSRLEAEGISFTTLAEEKVHREDWLEQFKAIARQSVRITMMESLQRTAVRRSLEMP